MPWRGGGEGEATIVRSCYCRRATPHVSTADSTCMSASSPLSVTGHWRAAVPSVAVACMPTVSVCRARCITATMGARSRVAAAPRGSLGSHTSMLYSTAGLRWVWTSCSLLWTIMRVPPKTRADL